MASRVELVFEKVATLPQAKTTPQINPVPPKSNPGHGGRLRSNALTPENPIECLEYWPFNHWHLHISFVGSRSKHSWAWICFRLLCPSRNCLFNCIAVDFHAFASNEIDEQREESSFGQVAHVTRNRNFHVAGQARQDSIGYHLPYGMQIRTSCSKPDGGTNRHLMETGKREQCGAPKSPPVRCQLFKCGLRRHR